MGLAGRHFHLGSSGSHPPWSFPCARGNYTEFLNCSKPGLDGELLKVLSTLLHFTFDVEVLQLPPNQTNWDHYFADVLSRGVVDFTANSLAINEDLEDRGVQFAGHLIYTDRGFMIRQPTKNLRLLLTRPFEKEVWWCLLASVFVLTTLCAVVWGPDLAKETPIKNQNIFQKLVQPVKIYSRSLWTVGVITIQQSLPSSYYLHQRPYTQKILVAVWIVGSFVLASSYGAMLISVLLDLKAATNPFTDVHQLGRLIQNSGYRTILPEPELESFQGWMAILRHRPLFRDYVQALTDYPPRVVPSFAQVYEEVLADPYLVYPCRLTEIKYRINNVDCKVTFVMSWEENIATGPGFSSRFSEQELETFRRTFLTLNTAVFDDIRYKYIPKPVCPKPDKIITLSVNQLQGGFMLLGGGALVGLSILLTEAFIRQVHKQTRIIKTAILRRKVANFSTSRT